jgi:MFS family permease
MSVTTISSAAALTAARPYRLLFGICLVCYLFCGLVATLVSVYLPAITDELLGPVSAAESGRVGAYIQSLFLLGWMLGGIGFGVLGDRFGRIQSFVFAVLLCSGCTLLLGMASSWITLVIYRFIAGIGVGGIMVLATVLASESWPAQSRRVAIGILAVTFPVGILMAGAVNNLLPDWRDACWLGGIPLVVALVAAFRLKEPAARANTGRLAVQENPGSLGQMWQLSNRRNLIVGATLFGAMLIGLWAIFAWMPTWVQSLFTGTEAGQQERGTVMMLLGSGGIIGGAFSGFIVNRLGYRRTFLLTFGGSFAMCYLLFGTNPVFTPLIYLQTALLALFFGVSQGALAAYLPELFPASIRATATGFCFNIGRLATAGAVFFVGTLVSVLGGYGAAVMVFSATFLVGFVIALLAIRPEKPLAFREGL